MTYFWIVLILLFGSILRLYGINWDAGFHLHPDERMLIMVAERIHFFDQLNPQFFNYGSLPIYLLKGVSQLADFLFSTNLANYQGMLYVGRSLSIFFDLLTILFIYKITRLLFPVTKHQLPSIRSQNPSSIFYFLPSIFYAIAFFPIQNSHFFISDVFLTTLTTLLIYLLLKYLKKPSMLRSYKDGSKIIILIGITFAAMLATKFTAIIFLPIIVIVLFLKRVINHQLTIKQLAIDFSIFYFLFSIFYFIFMPFAFLDYKKFLADIFLQIKMNSNPYIFPYTLQYVGTIPYFYYLKNIFFWGLGPIITVLSLIGIINLISNLIQKSKVKSQKYKLKIKSISNKSLITHNSYLITFFLFYLFYFLVIGRSAVKFMRYLLPLYPFLAIMTGYGLTIISEKSRKDQLTSDKSDTRKIQIYQNNSDLSGLSDVSGIPISSDFFRSLPNYSGRRLPVILTLILSLLWSLMFINIYSQKHTRIAASDWMLKNIPTGSTLAVEHWDDRLPIFDGQNYFFEELQFYNFPDDEKKWLIISQQLQRSDYLIIASNRLYTPLQKLSDCKKYKVCYPKTAEYYKKLFNNQLPFQKIAEFSVSPSLKIPITNYQLLITDDSADESFTVYDHPKIMIFKKNLNKI